MIPEEQVRWGRIGGLTAHARHGADEMLGPARAGFRERFRRMVDPTGELDPAERERRAEKALRAHMLRLSEASARARNHNKPDRREAALGEMSPAARPDPSSAAPPAGGSGRRRRGAAA
jgi:hypothetical protein